MREWRNLEKEDMSIGIGGMSECRNLGGYRIGKNKEYRGLRV